MSDRISPGGAIIVGTGAIADAHGAFYSTADSETTGEQAASATGNTREGRGSSPRPRLSAVVDVDNSRARAFAERHGVSRVFDNLETALNSVQPEVVHICTPPWLHTQQTITSLHAGAWVLCEKPACGSLAELDRIEAAEKSTGRYAATVFQWRFGSGMRELKRRIQDGVFGRPLVAVCNTLWYRDETYYAVPWRGKWSTELGGPTVIHGIHLMDTLLWLLGDWAEISARAPTLIREVETEDVSAAIVRFTSGAVATIINSVLSPRQETYLRIDFENGTVEAAGLYSVTNEQWRYTSVPAAPGIEQDGPSQFPGDIEAEIPASQSTQIGELYRDMRIGRAPLTTGRERRRTVEFLTGLYKSAFTGVAVTPSDISRDDPFYHRLNGTG
ncbi:MAG: Gfo/Idh/MocA family protein [Alkalispirochaeta sp.]